MKICDLDLAESFDSDVKGRVLKSTSNIFVTAAQIGSRIIRFTAASDYAGVWDVVFIEKSELGDTFGKSGSGNELQVFSFIINSLKFFISKYSPDIITFTADKGDSNRASLYTRLVQRIKEPGYHLENIETDETGKTFIIARDGVNISDYR